MSKSKKAPIIQVEPERVDPFTKSLNKTMRHCLELKGNITVTCDIPDYRGVDEGLDATYFIRFRYPAILEREKDK